MVRRVMVTTMTRPIVMHDADVSMLTCRMAMADYSRDCS